MIEYQLVINELFVNISFEPNYEIDWYNGFYHEDHIQKLSKNKILFHKYDSKAYHENISPTGNNYGIPSIDFQLVAKLKYT